MDRSPIRIVRDEVDAKLLTDPMRREFLRLLAKDALTENDLAEALGLSAPSVGYHLRALKKRGFITIVRKEPEEHGIIQKFYQTNALVHIVDMENLPLYVKRYFMPNYLERARGVVAGLTLLRDDSFSPSSGIMEKLAVSLGNTISKTAQKYEGSPVGGDPEGLINRLYKESLNQLLRTDFRMLSPAVVPK